MKIFCIAIFFFPIIVFGQLNSSLDLSSEFSAAQKTQLKTNKMIEGKENGNQTIVQAGYDNHLELDLMNVPSNLEILQNGNSNILQSQIEGNLQAQILQTGTNELHIEMTGNEKQTPVTVIQHNFSLPVYIQIKH